MKHTCPSCSFEWEAKLASAKRGPRKQLAGLTKKERSAKMRALVQTRWAAKRAAAAPVAEVSQ